MQEGIQSLIVVLSYKGSKLRVIKVRSVWQGTRSENINKMRSRSSDVLKARRTDDSLFLSSTELFLNPLYQDRKEPMTM